LAKQYGIDITIRQLNFKKTKVQIEQVIHQLQKGIQSLLLKHNVDVYKGYGRILGPSIFSPLAGSISIEYDSAKENTILVPKYVLIATGSNARSLANINIDGNFIMN